MASLKLASQPLQQTCAVIGYSSEGSGEWVEAHPREYRAKGLRARSATCHFALPDLLPLALNHPAWPTYCRIHPFSTCYRRMSANGAISSEYARALRASLEFSSSLRRSRAGCRKDCLANIFGNKLLLLLVCGDAPGFRKDIVPQIGNILAYVLATLDKLCDNDAMRVQPIPVAIDPAETAFGETNGRTNEGGEFL